MKALELLYQYQQADEIADGYMSKPITEAIKELEELQNRTCKNCKYATLDSARYLPVHKCLVGCNGVDYDFYCNKWEAK